jgi:hypothetical protein
MNTSKCIVVSEQPTGCRKRAGLTMALQSILPHFDDSDLDLDISLVSEAVSSQWDRTKGCVTLTKTLSLATRCLPCFD